MVKDPSGRIREVLKVFVEHGAPDEILYINKPHIGTDNLRHVIVSMRKQMIAWGAEFYFSSKVTDILLKEDDEMIKDISKKQKNYKFINTFIYLLNIIGFILLLLYTSSSGSTQSRSSESQYGTFLNKWFGFLYLQEGQLSINEDSK